LLGAGLPQEARRREADTLLLLEVKVPFEPIVTVPFGRRTEVIGGR